MSEVLLLKGTALLAKDKGLDIETTYCYLTYPIKDFNTYERHFLPINWNKEPNAISAPTLGEMVNWLLSVHEIFVTVDIAYEEFGKYAVIVYGCDYNGEKKLLIDGMTVFNSPSEALQEGIEEALKLI